MNVVVAIAWPNHIHHRRAVDWFVGVRDAGWATCPATEAGFVRVSSNNRAIPDAKAPVEAIHLLRELRASGLHRFWEDRIALTDDPFGVFARVLGHRQVTDAWMLSVALLHGGALATFDRGIAGLAGDHADRVALIG